MPKPYGMTKKGKLHWFLRQNAGQQFTLKQLKVKFPNFKGIGAALNDLAATGAVEVQGERSGRWYSYPKAR